MEEYSLPNEYKRSAFYLFLVFWIAFPYQYYRCFISSHGNSTDHLYFPIFFLIFISILFLISIFWKIRIDNLGIHQRFLFNWNHWFWSQFQSGKILPNETAHSYFCPEKAFFKRTLSFGILKPDQILRIESIIDEYLVLSDLPSYPDEFLLKDGFIFKRHTRLNEQGITHNYKKKTSHYKWNTIDKIKIWKANHFQKAFFRIEILGDEFHLIYKLPEMRFILIPDRGKLKANLLINYLSEKIKKDKVFEIAISGKPQNIYELQERKVYFLKRKKDIRNGKRLIAASFCLSIILEFLFHGLLFYLLPMTVMFALFFMVITSLERTIIINKLNELDTWQNEMKVENV